MSRRRTAAKNETITSITNTSETKKNAEPTILTTRVSRSLAKTICKANIENISNNLMEKSDILLLSNEAEIIPKINKNKKTKKIPENEKKLNTKSPSKRKLTKNNKLATPEQENDHSDDDDNSDDTNDVTPTKQTKLEINKQEHLSACSLLNRMSLASPEETQTGTAKSNNKYQAARKTLNSVETLNLPGREKELNELTDFFQKGLMEKKSASMYVSGPPGTGKTACLSKLLSSSEYKNKFQCVYVNCTSITSIGSVYKKICKELEISHGNEKESLNSIISYLSKKHKTILMVLDEIDQLVGKKQSVLYTIFEWPSQINSNLLLIGIANSLDLTDRLLSRLHAKCDLKPKLLHFKPYSKQQIINIFKARLEDANVLDMFPMVTIQLLAAKVSSISGDVRRALDIGRRVIEMAEEQKFNGIKKINISELGIGVLVDNNDDDGMATTTTKPVAANEQVQIKQVMQVLNQVYGTSQSLENDLEDTFPLQQKILICTLLLILKRDKNKDITIGRLFGVFVKICSSRGIPAVGQSEFTGLCELVETRGILRIIKNKEPRLCKIQLQWDEQEVTAALQDKQLIASILSDTTICIKK